MTMILRDTGFSVREATISGYILEREWLKKYGKNENSGLCWSVEVQMEEKLLLEQWLDPRFSCDNITLPMRRWRELEGKTVRFKAAGRNPRAPSASAYFGTHEPIPFSVLKLGARTGNRFVIDWEGTCDPMFDPQYEKNVPFHIRTEAVFKEISIGASAGDTDATMRERLSEYLDPDDFVQQPMKERVYEKRTGNGFRLFEPFLRFFGVGGSRYGKIRHAVFEPRL